MSELPTPGQPMTLDDLRMYGVGWCTEATFGLMCDVLDASERRRQAAIEYDRRPTGSEAWHFYAGVFGDAVRVDDAALVSLIAQLRGEGSGTDGE